MKYIKYEFLDRADMLTKLADYFTTNEEGVASPKDCNVVENVRPFITYAILDEEGEVVTPATPNPKYAVDVIFHSTFPTLAEEVTPAPTGAHTILGMESLYEERYNEVNGIA